MVQFCSTDETRRGASTADKVFQSLASQIDTYVCKHIEAVHVGDGPEPGWYVRLNDGRSQTQLIRCSRASSQSSAKKHGTQFYGLRRLVTVVSINQLQSLVDQLRDTRRDSASTGLAAVLAKTTAS